MSTFDESYSASEVPGGVLGFVPPTAIPDGTTIGITPSHVYLWAKIKHTGDGPGELVLAVSQEGFDDGVYWPVGSKGSVEVLSAVDASKRIVLGAVGDGVEAAAMFSYTRQKLTGRPELETDAGFPAYDGTDSDNIIPGVDDGVGA